MIVDHTMYVYTVRHRKSAWLPPEETHFVAHSIEDVLQHLPEGKGEVLGIERGARVLVALTDPEWEVTE